MNAVPTLSGERRRLLESMLSGEAGQHRRPGEAVERQEPGQDCPLSAEQWNVWLHASMAAPQPLFNESITIHRRGPLDVDALERALNEVLRRHEIWRSSIVEIDGQPRLRVQPGLKLRLPITDLSHLAPSERDNAARRLAAEDAREPFDMARAPLLRARLVRMAEHQHRLYLTLHHIIFDGVSIYRVLMPELAALYAAFARGEAPSLPEPSLQYADYVLWRERQLREGEFAGDLAYWRAKLAGDLPELPLPANRKPPPSPTWRGSMETFELSPEFTARLKAFSERHGVTLYVTLLTAFKALLHRYCGLDDIIVGGVTDMRRRPELEKVIGYFLNSVALRTAPAADKPFADYLREVQATVVEALDASNVPFDRVVREVRPRRDGARHPLFQVLFSIEPPAPTFADGWDLTQMDVVVGTAKFDLYLELDEHRDRLVGRFLYSTDLFDADAIVRMIGHWRTLLTGVLADPMTPLAALPVLTAPERDALLVDANRTARDFPRTTINALIEDQVRATPDAVAVQCGAQSWRYGDLDQQAAKLAARLRRAGVAQGDLVGIAIGRSLDMVAGLLAILKLGAAYLPLDPGLPPARIAALVEDARPAAILADALVAAGLPPVAPPVVRAGHERDEDQVPPEPCPTAGADDLAYVLYTSGSTGRPKAVEIAHRSVVNLLTAVRDEIDFGPGDTLLAVTTLSFDIAALELFLPLISGGRLIIADHDEATDPGRLAALTRNCTVMQATPATWRGLIAGGWTGHAQLRILCGGEALPTELARALLARGEAVWNLYGPTETTIWSLCHRVRESDDPPPIGRPLANTSIFILDPNGTAVPDLAAGELMIGGEGLARAYRGDPELTAEKFVAFPDMGADRLYRTGDRVRRRSDGAVEFLGRADNQVKIRGFRIGLEEVEAALAQHPRISGAAVGARPDPSGESSLTAYVAGEGLSEADVPELRGFLRDLLPAYMVPTHFMLLPALPMTANGKIDRHRLPAPRPMGAPRGGRPRDDLERTLARLWKEVLGVPAVGLDDDFFDLGGHSLLACMLMAKIEAVVGRELPLVTLFQSPTVASLADTLRSAGEPAFSHLVPLRPTGVGAPLFIVHGIFGNVLQLKALAERLPVRRPVFALQARGVDPRQEPHGSIAEMVEAYVAAIRQVQPSGPYALAGYSYGGLIAYEMARALRARGETVEILALIETELYARFLPWPDKLGYWLELVRRVAAKVSASPLRSVPGYLASKVRQFGHRVQLRAGLRDDFVTFDEVNGPMSERYRRMYAIGVDEFRRFRPGPYDGKLSLFQIGGVRFDACDPGPIWRRAAASVELFEIEGEHNRVMEEPFVGTLANQLGRCLAELAMVSSSPAGGERGAPSSRRRLAKAWAWRAP